MRNVEDKTLCALQEEGYIESNTEDFIKLIQPARFFAKTAAGVLLTQITFAIRRI